MKLGWICLLALTVAAARAESPREIVVDTKAVAVEEFLGFGAEWDPQFWAEFNRKQGVTEGDWRRVVERIRWMRLPLARMMMQARWCTAGDGNFDWDCDAMRGLYRHLDVCQREGIAVFLTDWGCATWAKVPGFFGNDDPKFAVAIGTYLDYLIRKRGYTCIKYFVLVNEPNFEGGGWEAWKRGAQNVARVIADRKLPVTLVGTDESADETWHRRGVDELANVFGVWDIHRYHAAAEVRDGKFEAFVRAQRDYALAHDPRGKEKPFIIGEAGMSDGLTAATSPHTDSYDYGVFMADYAVQATRAGAAAVSAWMLDDSSHEGFNWGMWKNKASGQALKPWFYPWALLTRAVPRDATIYKVESLDPNVRVLVARRKSAWTICAVNRGDKAATFKLRVPSGGKVTLRHYLFSRDSTATDKNGFPIPVEEVKANLREGVKLVCPADAVIVATSLR